MAFAAFRLIQDQIRSQSLLKFGTLAASQSLSGWSGKPNFSRRAPHAHICSFGAALIGEGGEKESGVNLSSRHMRGTEYFR